MIKSPLRYPGGKQRAIAQIANYLPQSFHEFREPFIGGGSVFLYICQTYPDIKYWINDLNEELYHFWLQSQNNLPALVEQVWQVKKSKTFCRDLFNSWLKLTPLK